MSKEDLKNNEELEENQQGTNESESDGTSTEDVKNESNDADKTDNNNEGETESVEESENKVTQDDNINDNLDEDDSENKTVPYKRFKEVNEKMKLLQAELDKIKQADDESQAEPDKEENEIDENESNEENSEADTNSSKLEEYEKVFNEMFEMKMNSVPEEFRDLIPDGDDLFKIKWIESAISKGLFESKEVKDFGNKGNNPSTEEQANNSAFIRDLGRKF